MTKYWLIPENIRTIPQVASWNSKAYGKGFFGLDGLEFSSHEGEGEWRG